MSGNDKQQSDSSGQANSNQSNSNQANSNQSYSSHRTSRYASYTVGELKHRKRQFTLVECGLFIVALILAWASFGLMMRTGFLPVFDLGYSWFDEYIVNFFGITAGRTAA